MDVATYISGAHTVQRAYSISVLDVMITLLNWVTHYCWNLLYTWNFVFGLFANTDYRLWFLCSNFEINKWSSVFKFQKYQHLDNTWKVWYFNLEVLVRSDLITPISECRPNKQVLSYTINKYQHRKYNYIIIIILLSVYGIFI